MATDDFNRANAGNLGANWTALAGTWTINSNAAEVADDDGPTGYYARRDAEGDLGSADHWSEVVPVGTQTDGASNCGPAVRHRSGATTGYQFVTKFSDSCEFWRVVAGSEQGPLATFTAAVNSGDTCRLEAVGRTFRFKVNGTIVNVLTDTNIADGQRPAMNGYNGNSSDLVRVDSWAGNLMTTLTAPYVVDWSAQVTGTGTTLTPTIPVTPAAGDLVLVQTTSRDAAQTMSAPGSEGWSSIQAPSQTGLEDVLWGKIWGLGATDDTTPTFSIGSGTAGWGATAVIIRNPSHATAPWTSVSSAVVASGSQSNAAAATVTCPSVSHTGNNRTVVRVGSSADDNGLNAPNQGFLWYGGTAYDSTTGNDFSQAMSVAEDITVTTSTSTSTFAESVNGNDVSNGITLVLAIPAGNVALTAAEAAQSQSVDGATLTQVHSLIEADADQAQTVDSATLTQAHVLVVDDATQGQSADAATLAVAATLVPADALQAQSVDSGTITQAHTLVPADADQAQTVDAGVLTQAHVLDAADAGQLQVADAPTITQAHALVAADASQAQMVDNIDVLVGGIGLDPDDATHSQTADSAALAQVHILAVGDATQAHRVDQPPLTQAHLLVAVGATQAQAVDSGVLVGEVPDPNPTIVRLRDRTTPSLADPAFPRLREPR